MYFFTSVLLQTLAMKESAIFNLVGFHVLSTKVWGNIKGRRSRAPVTLIWISESPEKINSFTKETKLTTSVSYQKYNTAIQTIY